MQRSVGGDTVIAGTREAEPVLASPEALYVKLRPGPGRQTSEVSAHQTARIHRAMIEIVAERGYDAVKVHDVVSRAGVSTRAFYELFDGKEDCFLRTHELLMRRAARGIIVTQAGDHGWRERLELLCAAFEHLLMHEPGAVCLAALDAYTAGPAALEQARRAQSTIEAMLSETFARGPKGVAVPPLVVEGMVASVARIVRTRFAGGRERDLPGLVEGLRSWAMSYPDKSAGSLPELDSRSMPLKLKSWTMATSPADVRGDRTVILTAVAKLVGADGYASLTVPRIRTRAGVSRRKFSAHFDGVEDCFLAAMDERATEALERAGRAHIGGRSWAGGIYRAIATLSDQVTSDSILTSVCYANDFLSGSSGARARTRLIKAVTDQLVHNVPATERPGDLSMEASAGAIWELFHRYVVRVPRRERSEIAATLSYMALAPVLGPSEAVAAIRQEQAA